MSVHSKKCIRDARVHVHELIFENRFLFKRLPHFHRLLCDMYVCVCICACKHNVRTCRDTL